MANILDNIIPDPDTGIYSSRVSGINGNECIINELEDPNFAGMRDTVLFYLKNDTDYSNKLSHWTNDLFIPVKTFNPGINRWGWVFHINMQWVYLAPQFFPQRPYAPFWLWFENLNLGTSSKWCYFDRSQIGEHWCFQKQYINPNPTNSSDKIYDEALGIKIVETGKPEGFGVYMFVHELGSNRAFIVNSQRNIFMSSETISGVPRQLNYIKLEIDI